MILEHEIALYQPAFSDSTQTIISTLPDAIVCEITEERNGMYELYMEYPQNGVGAENIAPDTVITAPTSEPRLESSSTVQPFRVYKVERSTDGRLKVYAEHISYQINSMVVPRIIGLDSGNTVSEILEELEEDAICGPNHMGCPFDLTTDKTTSAVYYLSSPRSLRSALMGSEGSVLDHFGGGEYVFDWYKIKLCASRGADRGFSVEYGKNLSEANLERDTSGAFTAVFPFWLSGDGKSSQAQYLPYSEDRCVFGSHVTDFSYARIFPLDLSGEFESMPTETQLRDRATAYLNANGATGIPNTITVKVVQGAEDEDVEIHSGYPPVITISSGQITNVETAFSAGNNVVRLCDTVTVDCPPLGVSVKAKVVKTVWDAITERYKELEIGAVKSSLAGTIAGLENSVSAVAQQAGYSYLPLSGGNMSGALGLAHNTWNPVGDDALFGSCNATGCVGIKSANDSTRSGILFGSQDGQRGRYFYYNTADDFFVLGGTTVIQGGSSVWGGDYYKNGHTYIIQQSFSFSASCGAGAYANQNGSVAVTGYTPLGVVGYNITGNGSAQIHVYRIQASGNIVYWHLRNHNSTAFSGTIEINILYMAT